MSLTLILQSPPRPIDWFRPLIGRWGGLRAGWRRSRRSLAQAQCSACGFQHRSPSARSACCFPREGQGSGDLWLQCLKITWGYCTSSKLDRYLEAACAAHSLSCVVKVNKECLSRKAMASPWAVYLRKQSGPGKHFHIGYTVIRPTFCLLSILATNNPNTFISSA